MRMPGKNRCRCLYLPMILAMVIILVTPSCKKLLEIPAPETETVRSEVFEDESTAMAALSGVYNKLVNSPSFGGGFSSINISMGLYADELVAYQGLTSMLPYYNNQLDATMPSISSGWSSCYNIIYTANAVIEGAANSNKLPQGFKNQLSGEALFVRAFIHFYLVNQFGDVPYISTTNYLENSRMPRSPVASVYQSIIADLLQAKTLLPDSYPAGNRVRANRGAVTALLARVYLYNREWSKAEAEAGVVINNAQQYELLSDLDKVFLKDSREAIWQLIPKYGATSEGESFILLTQPNRVSLRNDFMPTTFSPDDQRKQKWTGSVTQGFSTWYYPYKYKVKTSSGQPTEYSMMLRLGEQYLVRAEARAEQNKLAEAAADINAIRGRAGLTDTTAASKTDMLAIIEKERRAELFTEWGHRFFDLKRRGRLEAVLGVVKPGWNSTDALLPIPQSEILANGNMTQNDGY